jgi:hypothetical protein
LFTFCNNVLEQVSQSFHATSAVFHAHLHGIQRPSGMFQVFQLDFLSVVANGDQDGLVRDTPLLPLPSPPVNPGAPLQRIVTNGLSEACQGLQIAGSWFRGFES